MRLWFFGGLIVLVHTIACNSKQQQPAESAARLTINVNGTQLRESPGEDGRVVRELPQGAVLQDLGEVSDFTTRINLCGIWFDEPWLKVRTEDGVEGWVYGGALSFEMDDRSDIAKLLMEKRLQTLFGASLSDSIRIYRLRYQKIGSAQDFAETFRKGNALRDTMTRLMQDQILIQNPEELPDLFWLREAMPGMVPQLVAEGTAYFLFWDFAALNQQAKMTPESIDDDFVALNLELFPEDSIEYFFPAWFMQTWDYGGSSLLGRGVHYQTLEKIDKLLKKSDLFTPELTRLKTRLLNDITQPDVTYWEKKENIIIELDSITQANFEIFTNADKIALQTRRQQFETPERFGIQLNMQTGSY